MSKRTIDEVGDEVGDTVDDGAADRAANRIGGRQPFRRRTIAWLAGIAATSFAIAIGVAIFAEEIVPTSTAGAHGYSRSAIGHHGLVALLRALDIHVLQSEHDSAGKAGDDAVLVAAEPLIVEPDGPRAQALRAMRDGTRGLLLVLPKWYGLPDDSQPAWVSDVALLPIEEVTPVLDVLGIEATVTRPAQVSGWIGSEDITLEADPVLPAPQLLTSEMLVPVISCNEGMLLGAYQAEEDAPWLLVLADPDLLSNHGLKRGRNAHLTVAVIELLRWVSGEPMPDTVVFDETLHGFQKEPSLWRALFEFPLALATIQVLLAAVALLWASLGRLGKPITPPPAIAPGKGFLIHNTATLLRQGGHSAHALARYLDAAMREVARALHAPPQRDAAGLRRWLARAEGARRVTHTLEALGREVGACERDRKSQARAVRAALHIHQWREEMIRGSRDRSRD